MSIENSFNEIKESVEEAEKRIEELRSNKLELIQSLERNKNQISLLSEKESYYKKDKERLSDEINKFKESIISISETINNIQDEKKIIDEEYKELLINYNEKNEDLIKLNRGIKIKEEELENEKKQSNFYLQ